MMGACSTALAEALPEQSESISAFAASSNLLTYATGLFVSAFIALPLANVLFNALSKLRAPSKRGPSAVQFDDAEFNLVDEQEKPTLIQTLGLVAVMSLLVLIVNWVNSGVSPLEALPGITILYICSVIGIFITKLVPLNVPNVAWISIVAILIALPYWPWSNAFIEATDKLQMLALITPALAYSGLALSKVEISVFRKSGFRLALISLLVFTGTFFGSVIIANALL